MTCDLTPLIPLSFEGEGEMNKREALAPLKHYWGVGIYDRIK